jgi:hypothetical protein
MLEVNNSNNISSHHLASNMEVVMELHLLKVDSNMGEGRLHHPVVWPMTTRMQTSSSNNHLQITEIHLMEVEELPLAPVEVQVAMELHLQAIRQVGQHLLHHLVESHTSLQLTSKKMMSTRKP